MPRFFLSSGYRERRRPLTAQSDTAGQQAHFVPGGQASSHVHPNAFKGYYP